MRVHAGPGELEAGQVAEVVRRLEGPAVAGVGDPPAVRRTHVAVAVERPALEHELERLDDHAVVEVPAAGGGVTGHLDLGVVGLVQRDQPLAEVLAHVGDERRAVVEDQPVVVTGGLGNEAVLEAVPVLGVEGAQVAVLELADRADVALLEDKGQQVVGHEGKVVHRLRARNAASTLRKP